MSALLDSLQRGVNKYFGGRPALLARLCLSKSDEVFRKELQGGAHHKLGAEDALAAAVACCQAQTPHCYDYAIHVAQECGGRFVIGEAEQAPTGSPLQKIGCLTRETAHVTQSVLDALADGRISDNELAVIEDECAQAEEVLRKLKQAARAVNAAGKPAPRAPYEREGMELLSDRQEQAA